MQMENAPAKAERIVPIVFCADANYGFYLPVIIQSVIDNASPNNEYHLIIFDCGIKPEHFAVLQRQIAPLNNFCLISHNISVLLRENNFIACSHWPVSVYGRLFIPELCPDYDKIIYADIDIIFNSDIAELLKINLGDACLGGVRDIGLARGTYEDKKSAAYFRQTLKLDNVCVYINSGLLIFNAQMWRRENIAEACVQFARTHKLDLPDQDAINSVCRGKIAYLPQRVNCIIRFLEFMDKNQPCPQLAELQAEFDRAYADPHANLHYTRRIKPWHDPSLPKAEIWWRYARKTEFYELLLANALGNKAGLNLRKKPVLYHFCGLPLLRVKFKPYRRRYYLFGLKKGHIAELKLNQKTGARSFYLFRLRLFTQLSVCEAVLLYFNNPYYMLPL